MAGQFNLQAASKADMGLLSEAVGTTEPGGGSISVDNWSHGLDGARRPDSCHIVDGCPVRDYGAPRPVPDVERQQLFTNRLPDLATADATRPLAVHGRRS